MKTMNKEDDICWYHGDLTREEADELLKGEGIDNGTFLVRNSSSSKGDFVLSVVWNDEVSHFQIRRHKEDAFFSIDENIKFHGLESLVEHYIATPEGLCPEITDFVLTSYISGEAPPHDSRRHGNTNLLHRATSCGNYQIVSLVLNPGYRVDAKNQEGQTAVHLGCIKGQDDIVRKLICHNANVNCIDTAGNTPLHYACRNNFPSTVRLLVQVGNANIQARNTITGSVPLHEAASRGHIEVVKELLSLNAPVNPRNQDNYVPSQLARANGFIECAEIFENYKSPAPKTKSSEWYHGTLGRQEAEHRIKKHCNKDGTFLVRWSESTKENVLTLLSEDKLKNYIIHKHGDYLFIDNGPYLDSLEHIVDYYSFISDGLPTVLQIPVPPAPKPPLPEFSTMPRPKKNSHSNTNTLQDDQTLKLVPSQFKNITFTTKLLSVHTPTNINNNNIVTNEQDDYIPSDKLKLGKVIGEGEFGSVYQGTYQKNSNESIPVAIKALRNDHLDTNRKEFLTEANVMMKLNHHCIVKMIGLSMGPPLLMVQELLSQGSLLAYLIKCQEFINPNYEFKIWAAQIACGMNYLEEKRFVHRDLAARNILLASKNQVKISDFGLSRALGVDNEYYKAMQGGKWPIKWYAPESFNYGKFSNESDVWSFGVTIWEMYSFGEVPYGDMKGQEAIKLINDGERLAHPEGCPDHIYEVMKRCWEYEAVNRPKFSELFQIFTSDCEYMNVRELLPENNLA